MRVPEHVAADDATVQALLDAGGAAYLAIATDGGLVAKLLPFLHDRSGLLPSPTEHGRVVPA